jgi:hypothetical protein
VIRREDPPCQRDGEDEWLGSGREGSRRPRFSLVEQSKRYLRMMDCSKIISDHPMRKPIDEDEREKKTRDLQLGSPQVRCVPCPCDK